MNERTEPSYPPDRFDQREPLGSAQKNDRGQSQRKSGGGQPENQKQENRQEDYCGSDALLKLHVAPLQYSLRHS